MANLPIPATISEITPSWINLATGHQPISGSIKIQGDIQEGFGFQSSVCRVSYQVPGNPPLSESIIVKLLPPNSSKYTDFPLSKNVDQREVYFYTRILPELLKAVPALKENVCKFYHGTYQAADPTKNIPRDSVLVMEDLKASNFEMMSFSGNGSEHVLHSLVTFMARLHYAGQVVSLQKGKSLPELYPFLMGLENSVEWQAEMQSTTEADYAKLEELFKTQNIPEEVWKRYEKLKPFTGKIVELVENNGRKFPGFIHGDVWPPNIMVHESLPVKVLDWQYVGYRDVAYDLGFMLQTVLPLEILSADTMRKLLYRYWTEFDTLCEQGEYASKIKRRQWEELERQFFTWASTFVYLMFLPCIDCAEKDYPKYAKLFRVWCEEINLPEFLLEACGANAK